MLKDKEKQCVDCNRVYVDLFNQNECPYCREIHAKNNRSFETKPK